MAIENRLPRVEIEFCTGCKWHLRAGWMAQELLLTFNNTIGELALIPGGSAVFIVRVNGEVVYNRKDEGRFPEMKELKQLVRNVISPEMGLGHSDTAVKSAQGSKNNTTASSSESSATTTAQTSTVPGQEEVVVAASETKATSQNEGNGPEVECKTCL